MNRIQQLHWPLIVGMGALAAIHPFLNITGMMDVSGRPFGPVMTNVLISAIWLAIVVLSRVREPLLTLTVTGLVYGLFAFLLGTMLAPILTGRLSGLIANPLILPFTVTGILVTNTLWGFIVGLVALAIQQAYQPRNGQHSQQ
jgi:hypothetical protein